MIKAYIDANVLIGYLRGQPEAQQFLNKMEADKQYELWISAAQQMEIVFFMCPDEEDIIMQLLAKFKVMEVNQSIVNDAGKLYQQWNASHGVRPNHAVLAATALQTDGCIFTMSLKYYPMPDLNMYKAWD